MSKVITNPVNVVFTRLSMYVLFLQPLYTAAVRAVPCFASVSAYLLPSYPMLLAQVLSWGFTGTDRCLVESGQSLDCFPL